MKTDKTIQNIDKAGKPNLHQAISSQWAASLSSIEDDGDAVVISPKTDEPSRDDRWNELHTCEPNDPFVGLIRLEDENGSKRSCCHYRLFVSSTAEEAARFSTRFGRRLHELGVEFGNDARTHLFQYSSWNWVPGQLHDFLLCSPRYIDNDHVVWRFSDCSVCLSELSFVRIPPCCNSSICQICWLKYVRTTAENSLSVHITGTYNLHCYGCDAFVPYNAALTALDSEDLAYILPPGHTSCSVAKCPVCLWTPSPIVKEGDSDTTKLLSKLQKKKGGRSVTCDRCSTAFCTLCGMTDHPDCSCKQLASNDHGYTKWAKQPCLAHPDYRNSRQCPKCKIPITLTGGCSHTTCPCGTKFCFLCGRRKLITGIGFELTHSSRLLPIISCPKLWKSKPKRIMVHSIIGIGLVLCLPLAIGLAPIVVPVVWAESMIRRAILTRRRH